MAVTDPSVWTLSSFQAVDNVVRVSAQDEARQLDKGDLSRMIWEVTLEIGRYHHSHWVLMSQGTAEIPLNSPAASSRRL